jgi:hypothetical protein
MQIPRLLKEISNMGRKTLMVYPWQAVTMKLSIMLSDPFLSLI